VQLVRVPVRAQAGQRRSCNPQGRPHAAENTPIIPEVSPNPFAEPVVWLETYRGYICGSVTSKNVVVPVQEEKTASVGLGAGGAKEEGGRGREQRGGGRRADGEFLQVREKKKAQV